MDTCSHSLKGEVTRKLQSKSLTTHWCEHQCR